MADSVFSMGKKIPAVMPAEKTLNIHTLKPQTEYKSKHNLLLINLMS